MTPALEGWGSTQVRDESGAVDSRQAVRIARPVVEVSDEGARLLGRVYWREIRRISHGLVRPKERTDGVDLHLLGRRPALLRFGAAELSAGGGHVVCRYPILGGVLARRAGGTLSLSQNGAELSLAVTGFVPRLGAPRGFPRWSGVLYALVQQRVHVAVSRGYFARLIAEAKQ